MTAPDATPADDADRDSADRSIADRSRADQDDAVADLCFRARALAQSHPMTESARRYRQTCHDRERADQPLDHFADWAATALDVGYCLRRTEEDAAGDAVATFDATDHELGRRAGEIAAELRTGTPAAVTLLPPERIVAALDRLIATELDKRADNVQDQLDDTDWADLEAYVSWWVVHGYCLRVAEADHAAAEDPVRVIVIGVGNLLHGDDGFGVEVARRLVDRDQDLPPGVTVTETGIGGIHLVHELMAGYDAAIVVDAVDRGRPPGTVMVIEADVIDVGPLSIDERHDLLADMHLATPERALMVARALGVLPEQTIIVGCQPVEIDTLGIGLTGDVERAVDVAVDEVLRCVADLVDQGLDGHR